MNRVEAIKDAIESLPDDDYVQLRQWFSDKDWLQWDKQIDADSAAGKLDFFINEALGAKNTGKLRDL
jgi:hypothetical protein